MKIVYLVSTLRRAGPTSQLLNLVRHLDRRRFDPVIVTLSPEPPDSMAGDFSEVPVPIRSLAMSRARALLTRDWRRALESLLGASLSDDAVVHTQGIRADVISSRHLHGVPRVATARNYPRDDYPMKFGPVLGRWMARSHLKAFRALPHVIACSSSLSGMLRRDGVEAKVIRNGVDTRRFALAPPADKAPLRRSLGLGEQAIVGVCVGALSERKDVLRVIRALRSIDGPEPQLLMIGGGPLETACRREAAGDPRIRFTGEVSDVTPQLRAADFFVSAAMSEGLPNAALEALACGLYAILSDIGPHREILSLAPEAGESFAVGDTRALAGALRRAATVARTGSARAPTQVEELFGAKRMSERYQALYATLSREATGGVQPA